MYNKMKVLGVSFDLKTVLISMMIGCLLCCHLLCSCVTKEGMNVVGSTLDHVMSKGVHSDTYDKIHTPYETTLGPQIPETAFSDRMTTAIRQVAKAQEEASISSKNFELGIENDLSKVMMKQQISSLGFQLTLNVRNKVLSSYKDIMNMPV